MDYNVLQYLLAARCDKVRQRQRQQQPQQCMPARWPPACLAASCLHAVQVLSGICVPGMVPGWRSGATAGCCGRIARSAERQQRARAAATRLIASAAHVCAIAMLSVRMPVHGVGRRVGPTEPSV